MFNRLKNIWRAWAARVPQLRFWARLIVLALFGFPVGAVVGALDFLFASLLNGAAALREEYLYWLLPFLAPAAVCITFCYRRFGAGSDRAMNTIFEVAYGKDKYLPLRTAPMMMFSSALTHLFGGSAGREGAAVQIGAAVSYWAGQKLHIKHTARIFLVAGMAAGFSGLFGTPVAAVLYAVEVLLAGTLDYRALLPACTASFSAVAVSRALGLPSSDYALSFQPELSLALVCKLAALGLVFGLTGGLFAFCLRKGREWGEKAFKNPYVRAAVLGVCLTVLLFLARGRYSGLGSNLIELSMTGGRVYPYDWVLKLFFTVLTLSAGLKGGEVTPLFSIGASLGAVLAGVVGLPVPVTAAVGYVCVFGGATNTFFAPLFVGAELFGYELLPFFFVACVVARLFNFGQSIYPLQRKFRFKKSV